MRIRANGLLMTLMDFKKLERISPRSDTSWSYRFTSWKRRQAVALRTAKVDYQCNFRGGLCKIERCNGVFGERACCHNCARNFGYLGVIPTGTAKIYHALFDKTLGFWRRGKGCILPRELRSNTCLGFHCGDKTVEDRLIQIGLKEIKPCVA